MNVSFCGAATLKTSNLIQYKSSTICVAMIQPTRKKGEFSIFDLIAGKMDV